MTAKFKEAETYLQHADPILSDLIGQVGPCRLARSRNHFLTLVEAIVWQQLSWHAALAIHDRLLTTIGKRRPTPADILETPERRMRKAGLSRQKTAFLKDLSLFFAEDRFPKRRLGRLNDEEIIDLLTRVKGIGRWTAEMFLIFGLNREDVFPFGDLVIRKAIGNRYGVEEFNKRSEIEPIADRWRPYRSIATWYLWQSADAAPLDNHK